ncbi:SMI1/KNR4 family protein [Halostreptopolyspora alba]|uniref:Knr4/Smi1-like domain-containing protein n=1 Tax=Halostreptopolyspora alba TaxID=2487137 RepID=A0A3N0E3Q3_9ACTN|nr:hypothetical protein EFW17_19090 [Nocardiopsaceae bacterium YIM 96095]
MLSDELGVLVDKLNDLGHPVVQWFVPGSSPSRVEEFLGSGVPEEVVAWFGWCDGIEFHPGQTMDDIKIIPGYFPISLEEAVGVRDTVEEIIGNADEDDANYSVLGEHWIPILDDGGGGSYAAVWGPGQSPSVASVLHEVPTEIEFPSLERMVAFFNECYRRGAFYVEDHGGLGMNPERCDELHSEFFA